MQNRRDRRIRAKHKKINTINIFSFILIITVFGILAIILPKPSTSDMEKRELATMPEFSTEVLFKGSYTKDLDSHYNDTFPFRNLFLRINSFIQENMGIRIDDVRIHSSSTGEDISAENSSSVEEKITTSHKNSLSKNNIDDSFYALEYIRLPSDYTNTNGDSSLPIENSTSEDESLVGEQRGNIFIYKDMALTIFGSSQSVSENYSNVLNKYADILGETIDIYNMVIPSSIELYIPKKYKSITSPEKPNIDFIYSKLNPKIKTVDAYTALSEHKDEYVYFRSDHHWTGLGAYYSYLEFSKVANFHPLDITSLEKRTKENFLGTSYSSTQDSKLASNPDYVDYWIIPGDYTVYRYAKGSPNNPELSSLLAEYVSGGNSYSVFLHGDHPLITVKTNIKNHRKIVVVKESFGNAFSPFLAYNYEEVHIIDQRYFERNIIEYIKENNITELLFINNIFAANTTIRINEIENLLYK